MGSLSNSDVQAASRKQNEYFIPRAGIDREVITVDITCYLGSDALVRPGNYEAMIANLKKDSEHWEAERRKTVSSGQGLGCTSLLRTYVSWKSKIFEEENCGSWAHQTRAYYRLKREYDDGPSDVASLVGAMPETKLPTLEQSLTQTQRAGTPNPVAARDVSDSENVDVNMSKRKECMATTSSENVQEDPEREDGIKHEGLELTALDGAGVEIGSPRNQKRRRKMLCFCWELSLEV